MYPIFFRCNLIGRISQMSSFLSSILVNPLIMINSKIFHPLPQNYHSAMVRRTYESDATKIKDVDDLDDLVADKREAWRATSDKARRRQRRYKKRLTNRLVHARLF